MGIQSVMAAALPLSSSASVDTGCARVHINAYIRFHTAEEHLIAVLKPSILLQREI